VTKDENAGHGKSALNQKKTNHPSPKNGPSDVEEKKAQNLEGRGKPFKSPGLSQHGINAT